MAIDKEINDFQKANKHFQDEIKPQMLTEEDISSIEAFAAEIQKEANLVDDDPHTQRELFQRLNVEAVLFEEGNEKFIDISCVLGHIHSLVSYETSWYTDYSSAPAPESIQRGCPSLRHPHFQSPKYGPHF